MISRLLQNLPPISHIVKSSMSGLAVVCLAQVSFAGTLGTESSDYGNPGPTLTISAAGANTVTGTLGPTPTDGQDTFSVSIPAGYRVTSIAYSGNTTDSNGSALPYSVIGCGLTGAGGISDFNHTFSTPQSSCTLSYLMSTNFQTSSFAWTVTVNTEAVPTVSSPSTPDLGVASDSGINTGDNNTNDNTPTFSGTAEANSTVKLYSSVDGQVGSATADGSGNWSITASTLTEGAHDITATATVGANTSSDSAALAITIDTTSPRFNTITRKTPTSATTNADTVTWNVTFNELVYNFDATDIILSGPTGASVGFTINAADDYDIQISGGNMATYNGTVTLSFYNNMYSDRAGNEFPNLTPLSTNNNTYTLDNAGPAISIGSPSASSTTGGPITYTITYTDATAVNAITLANGDVTLNATGTATGSVNVTGSGTSTRTVTISSVTGNGTLGISLAAGTASDTLTNTSTSAGPSTTFTVDNAGPVVNSVSVPGNATYISGQNLNFTVNTNENVTVNTAGGTPRIALTIGAATQYATYLSGSGTSAVVFRYTVQSGDVDANGIAVGALSANGGTLKDAAGNDMTLTLNSVGSTASVLVDAVAPTVSSITSSTANGTYKVGDAISIQVNFSEAVTVSGTPQLTLETGATDRTTNYASGSGTSSLTFTYTVQAGDSTSDLDYVATSSLALNGGTISDAVGNNATLTLASPGAANSLGANKAIVVDGVVSTVSSTTSSTANGTYKVGDAISIQVSFSEAVNVTGTPQLTLETGVTDRTINYASGTGTSSLTFTYTVQAGDSTSDLDYVATSSLALNGGTISDAAGNNATLTLASPGAANSLGANKAIVVDGVAPTVSSINSSTANGTYKAGDTISIQVSFSETVTVTGTPQLTLETGATDRTVNYASGSGTSSLTFSYTVQAGDSTSDLDYVATNSLALNGGTISDAAGNNATLTLASPGAANSLGANKALVVDGVAPTVSSINSSTANGTYKAGDTISIQVNFSETVTVSGTPQLTLETGTTDRTINYASGTGTSILTFTYTVQAGDNTADLDYAATNSLALNGGTISDAAGNNATLTLASPGAANSLGANKAIVVDAVVPNAPAAPDMTIGTDSGSSNADNLTNDTTPTFTGTAEANSTVKLYSSVGGQVGSVTADGSGNWTITASTLAAGAHNITATATDAASNVSAASSALAITIDTTAPLVNNITRQSPATSPTDADTLVWTVAFNENVANIDTADLASTGTTATVTNVTGSGATYDVTVSGGDLASLNATVTLSFAGGQNITDVAGNALANTTPSGTNNNTFDVQNNKVGVATISGSAYEGQTLTVNVSDEDGTAGSTFTYQWMSNASNVGSDQNTYVIQSSDIGNTITVNVTYTDDKSYAEDITSAATATIISIEQHALNKIADTAGNSGSTPPDVTDYANAGVTGVTDTTLALVNIAIANQSGASAVDTAGEIQALVDIILEGQDDDTDGIPNFLEGIASKDTDVDGMADREDPDSDNDGITDDIEAGIDLTDSDADGIADVFDSDIGNDDNGADTGKTDANFDGVADSFVSLADIPNADADSDNIPNHLDLDSDNDSLLDVTETDGLDENGDGMLDETGDLAVLPLRDDDADDLPNYLDVTSDGTAFDIVVAGLDQFDSDVDGVIDNTIDMDNDGIMDIVDNAVGAFGSLIDFDGDGIPNHVDTDDDNDGKPDDKENPSLVYFTGLDADRDGIDDGVDHDVNGVMTGSDLDANGVQDDREMTDTDKDGRPDQFDADSDNDGVTDGADVSTNTGDDVDEDGNGLGAANPVFLLLLLVTSLLRGRKWLAAIALLMLSGLASAGESKPWHVGASVGIGAYDPDLRNALKLTEDNDIAAHLSVGYYFDSSWMLQLRYADLGKAEVEKAASIKYQSSGVNAQYTLPWNIDDYWFFYILGGVNSVKSDADKGLNLAEDKDTNLQLGAGTRMFLLDNIAWVTEASSYNGSVAVITTGVEVRF